MLPAVLAVIVTVSVLATLDLAMNVVTLTALLMVFSMGVDYGIFVVEAGRQSSRALEGTLLAIGLAWISTLLGFGLLALSQHASMQTIGVTATVGVSLAFTLASLMSRGFQGTKA